MEYGHFKRRDGGGGSGGGNFRDRDRDRGGYDRNRGGGGGGGYDRGGRGGDFRDRDRGFDRDRNSDRGSDRGYDRGGGFDRDMEESVFSQKVRAGKRRTYFFDVRKTRGNDYFITITESTRREDGYGYKRHKIFLYKEDFNRFVNSLTEVVNHVKTDLMPDFDYEEFDRRQAEWEAQNRDNEDEDRPSAFQRRNEGDNDDAFAEDTDNDRSGEDSESEDSADEERGDRKDNDDVNW